MGKSKTIPVTLSILAVAGGLGYLLFSSFGEAMVYYKTVDELLAEPERFDGQTVRINGNLVAGSVRQKPGTDSYRFSLARRGKVLEVAYSGVLPDAMQDGRELVVQGALEGASGRFNATEILTKCPSKHEARGRSTDL